MPTSDMAVAAQPTESSGALGGAGASLLARARRNDRQAITTMFRQFVPVEEQILAAEHLGTQGIWGLGAHSFACVTDRRVAALRVKALGEIEYRDGALESVNSAAFYQPSRLLLYLSVVGLLVVTAGLGVLLLPLTVQLFYRRKKSGLVLWVQEGPPVYLFADRKLLSLANEVFHTALDMRDERRKAVASAGSVH